MYIALFKIFATELLKFNVQLYLFKFLIYRNIISALTTATQKIKETFQVSRKFNCKGKEIYFHT